MRILLFGFWLIAAVILQSQAAANAQSGDSLIKISDNLYMFRDCSNVYLIADGNDGILIDFGSGKVLKHLSESGVLRVRSILITHHHRDQIQGLPEADLHGVEIIAPEYEKDLIAGATGFWSSIHSYINYNLRSHFNTVRESAEVQRTVKDGEELTIGKYSFKALHTPGHTDGALSYVATIDGKKIVFSNDLISSPGKVINYYDLHWDYMGFTQGMSASLESFNKIRSEQPDILLPSHGEPMEDPSSALDLLEARFKKLMLLVTPNRNPRTNDDMFSVSKHIVYLGSTSYALISDSLHAMIYDYGYLDISRIREFVKNYGIVKIDAVTYSHYHEDHIIRTFELLYSLNSGSRTRETEIWIFEEMVDVFEHPERYNLPCLTPFPIMADRIIRDRETINWEGIPLYCFHMPGQTTYHMGLMIEDEGKRYILSGDNIWHPAEGVRPMNSPVIPRNRYFIGDNTGYMKISRDLINLKADVIVPSHYLPFSVTPEDLRLYRIWANDLTELFKDVIDQPDPNMGMDPLWIRFYPYRVCAAPGGSAEIGLLITNHLNTPSDFKIELKYSGLIRCDAPVQEVKIKANSFAKITFRISISPGFRINREIICADITMNGRYFGEYAEMMLENKSKEEQ